MAGRDELRSLDGGSGSLMLDTALGGIDRITRADHVVWVVSGLFGVVTASSGLGPTGTPWFDFVAVAIGATLVIRVAVRGPWWSRTGAAGLAAALALNPLGAIFGVVGLAVGAVAPDPSQRVDDDAEPDGDAPRPVHRSELLAAFVAGCAINALSRMNIGGATRASTLIGGAVLIGVVGFAFPHLAPQHRRVARRVALAAGVYVVLATAAAGIAALLVRDDATTATDAARRGIEALEDGDEGDAARLLDEAAASLRRAEGGLGGPLTLPARLVPGLAQNVSAARSLAGAGADLAADAGASLRDVDLDRFGVRDGAVDLDAIRDAAEPVNRVYTSFSRFEETVEDSLSPWLAPPFAQRLESFNDRLMAQSVQVDNLVEAVELLPRMLGGEAPRRYLVLFTTPTEARGLGGFPGSWATIDVSNGRVEVSAVARISELNDASFLTDCSTCDPDMLQRYGRFGLTTARGGLVGPDSWSNLTIPASFPAIADAAWQLYPQATGSRVDGVVVMDPYVIETLASYGDPIKISALEEPIPTDGVAEFIITGQYLLPGGREERLLALDELSAAALAGLLSASLPEPSTLLSDIAPLIEERRLLFWTATSDEQRLLDGVGLIGDLPDLDPDDGGFSVAFTNAAANKIDRFITRETVVSEIRRDGDRFLRAEVTVRNDAPPSGLPRYVIGNEVGLPDGWHRMYISFYGANAPVSTTVDGDPQPSAAFPEDGWIATDLFADFAPGQQRIFVLEYPLPGVGSGDFEPVLWDQPSAVRTP